MKTPQSRGPSRDAFLSGRPRGMFPKGAYPTDGCIHPSLTVITPKKNQLITAKHYNGGAFFSFLCCTQEKKQVEKRRNANMPGRHLRLIGSAMGNMTMGRKRRHEVLDRLARLGPGLTPAQRNDFVWFKDAWDKKCSAEHSGAWPFVFSGMIQKILNDIDMSGIKNAFSMCVRNETQRCFGNARALTL